VIVDIDVSRFITSRGRGRGVTVDGDGDGDVVAASTYRCAAVNLNGGVKVDVTVEELRGWSPVPWPAQLARPASVTSGCSSSHWSGHETP